ncbi:hypothetical protein ACIP98_26650 [Streptomyces sp. NPDC088354]|uniref:hypothetical protein n=1 Tax=unclassified Streptomyces TaxID=2593676 RepID=UPI0029A6305F|nr:hypothetical protein [Streptomyces sp. MI02-7b]MDX3071930.1 hypothetical protein [Streptomyces sp. MI02-7b]
MPDDPSADPPHHPPSRRPRRSPWATAGVVLAVVLGMTGLAVVGVLVLASVALSNWGSNK